MRKIVYISLVSLGALLFYLLVPSKKLHDIKQYKPLSEELLNLRSTCPPGFQLNDNNECVSRNLYQQYEYDSIENTGVGVSFTNPVFSLIPSSIIPPSLPTIRI